VGAHGQLVDEHPPVAGLEELDREDPRHIEPLGDTAPVAPWTVMANVLGSARTELTDALPEVLADGDARVWLYGKSVKPGRKVGHVTAYGDDLEEVRERALHAAAWFRGDLGNESE
jgi:5-(carboxyamino)imidazole ribonucleotide synthase